MQWIAVGVAFLALVVTLALCISRKGGERNGIALVVLPLALITSLAALAASGLQEIYSFRQIASSGQQGGIQGILLVGRTLYLGQVAMLSSLAGLGIILIVSWSRPEPGSSVSLLRQEPETLPASKVASPLRVLIMSVAVLVCVLAAGVMTEFSDRFIAWPLSLMVPVVLLDDPELQSLIRAKEELDLGENPTIAGVSERISRLLEVGISVAGVIAIMCFLVFLLSWVSSRSVSFTRSAGFISAGLLVLAVVVNVRAIGRQRALNEEIRSALSKIEERNQDPVSFYRKAIELRPDFAPAHYYLGLALQEAGKEEEAQRELDEARRLGYKPPN